MGKAAAKELVQKSIKEHKVCIAKIEIVTGFQHEPRVTLLSTYDPRVSIFAGCHLLEDLLPLLRQGMTVWKPLGN